MAADTAVTTAPYGGWKSPVNAELINRGATARDFPCMVDGTVYWQESRPEENGRVTVVARQPDGRQRDLLPYPFSARSRVHEYGGLSWVVVRDSAAGDDLYFVEQSDQRLYRLPLDANPESQPQAVTADRDDTRFADLVFDPARLRLLCVMEQHHPGRREPLNTLAAIDLGGTSPGAISTLASGADFYAYPRLDASAKRLCWISWNHPDMPWDSTTLWCADIAPDGQIADPQPVAGGNGEAIFQPDWSPAGELYFVSDRTGWWNLYRHDNGQSECILPMAADFATPLWNLGMRTWGFIGEQRIAALYTRAGTWQLATIDCAAGTLTDIASPYTQLGSLGATAGRAVFTAGNATTLDDIASLDATGSQVAVLKTSASPGYDHYISHPLTIQFPTTDGDIAHGLYYPPRNPDYRGPEGQRPPLVVMCHGGPTGAAGTALNLKIQFWTSRGFALLDVNYRGSTGFGRDYRDRLRGQWGVRDIADAVAGVHYLAGQGLVDAERVLIRGSSAGGFTALAALTFTDCFRAGASLYGIGDLETLARDTHKFEARYLDRLIGPYPEQQAIYQQRSPINHRDKLRCPVIFFQGLEDKVVPPEQADEMVDALHHKKVPVAYIRFPDEGHGFRKASNIKKALEAELVFYRRILEIPSDEKLPAIQIDHF